MRVQRIQWLFLILFITLSGCSTHQGFDRAGMQDTLLKRMNLVGAREIKTTETKDAIENRSPFAEPFRLGVYFVRTEFPTRESIHSGEWLSAEKDQLVQRLAQLRSDQILREVVVLAEPTVRTLTPQELRQASVRYGIDVLLLVDGVGAVDRHNNAYALLYPTVIGAWLAPGTVIDALFILDGILWDLRTDKLLDQQTTEGQAQRTGAVVLVDDTDALREAKHRAIEAFGARLVEHLRSLRHEQSGAPSSPQ
jgi:rhombotail lipoprotein